MSYRPQALCFFCATGIEGEQFIQSREGGFAFFAAVAFVRTGEKSRDFDTTRAREKHGGARVLQNVTTLDRCTRGPSCEGNFLFTM